MTASCITLLTDFGWRDGYVAAMKGVLLSRCPDARLVDITHEIPPGDISAAAYVLRQAAPCFPKGSVHLVVVDPGVGSERRAVACQLDDQLFVAPDNGVLGGVLDRAVSLRVHEITHAGHWHESPSPVFHGRDIFAPVAAHLASRGELRELGAALDSRTLVRVHWPEPQDGRGEVIYVDRFGNLISNIALEADQRGEIEIAARRIPMARTYSDVAFGELLALRGSSGWLEIACNGGSAAELLGADRGSVVTFLPAK